MRHLSLLLLTTLLCTCAPPPENAARQVWMYVDIAAETIENDFWAMLTD